MSIEVRVLREWTCSAALRRLWGEKSAPSQKDLGGPASAQDRMKATRREKSFTHAARGCGGREESGLGLNREALGGPGACREGSLRDRASKARWEH